MLHSRNMMSTHRVVNYQKYRYTPQVGGGNDGLVYAISDEHVVKIAQEKSEWPERLYALLLPEREYHFALRLYNEGISVPQPWGIQFVTIRNWRNFFGLRNSERRGVVMQRLYGQNGAHTKGDLR